MASCISKSSLSFQLDLFDWTFLRRFFRAKFLHIRPEIGVLVFLWEFYCFNYQLSLSL
jgi:hypothetical protein